MTDDAGAAERPSRPRRRGFITVIAALLLIAGATAVAVGLLNQDADPAAAPPSTNRTTEPADLSAVQSPSAQPSTPVPPVPSTTAPAAVPVGSPVQITIPSIDVQSDLIHVGLDTDGALQVPPPGPTYDSAAWYDGSPRPGDIGAAVIIGHVDSAANGPSVFYRLGELTPGAEIQVRRDDDTVGTFVVDEVRAVPKDDFPTVEIYRRTDDPELRLITCGGDIGSDGHYVDNTVVFAHQV